MEIKGQGQRRWRTTKFEIENPSKQQENVPPTSLYFPLRPSPPSLSLCAVRLLGLGSSMEGVMGRHTSNQIRRLFFCFFILIIHQPSHRNQNERILVWKPRISKRSYFDYRDHLSRSCSVKLSPTEIIKPDRRR